MRIYPSMDDSRVCENMNSCLTFIVKIEFSLALMTFPIGTYPSCIDMHVGRREQYYQSVTFIAVRRALACPWVIPLAVELEELIEPSMSTSNALVATFDEYAD
jgi:hypothetical protein